MRHLATIAIAASAAAAHVPSIPGQFYGPDTVLVVRVDLDQITPSSIRQTLHAVIDEQAIRSHGVDFSMSRDVDSKLAQLDQLSMVTGMITSQGATSATIVVNAPEGADLEEPPAFLLLPVNSADAATQLISMAGMMGRGRAVGQAVHSDGQDWIVFHESEHRVPGSGSADRRAMFERAFDRVGDRAVSWVFAPNAQVRRQAENAPGFGAQAMAFVKPLYDADWFACWIQLGDRPQIGMGAELKDAESAAGFETQYNQGLAMLRMLAGGVDSKAAADPNYGGPMPSEIVSTLADCAALDRKGSLIHMALSTQELRRLTTLGVAIGDQVGDEIGPEIGKMLSDRMANAMMGR